MPRLTVPRKPRFFGLRSSTTRSFPRANCCEPRPELRVGAGVVDHHQPKIALGVAQHAAHAAQRLLARVVDRHHHVDRGRRRSRPRPPISGHARSRSWLRNALDADRKVAAAASSKPAQPAGSRSVDDCRRSPSRSWPNARPSIEQRVFALFRQHELGSALGALAAGGGGTKLVGQQGERAESEPSRVGPADRNAAAARAAVSARSPLRIRCATDRSEYVRSTPSALIGMRTLRGSVMARTPRGSPRTAARTRAEGRLSARSLSAR